MSYAYALLLIVVVVAAGLIAWQRIRLRELRAHVEASAVELQRLQHSCAMLAPAGVVERLFSDGPESIAEHKVFTAMFTVETVIAVLELNATGTSIFWLPEVTTMDAVPALLLSVSVLEPEMV